jgi:hypothetical protein
MKKAIAFSCTTAMVLSSGLLPCLADQPLDVGPPEIIVHKINPHFAGGGQPPTGSTSATSPISYHGGPVMTAPNGPNVYLIWYGNWNRNNGTDTPAGQQIVRAYLSDIGGSPYSTPPPSGSVASYFQINETYGSSSAGVSGLVTFTDKETTDSYSQGSNLSDRKVAAIVQNAIKLGRLPNDGNGIYFVLTSSDVSETSGFCTRYCGWHTYGSLGGTTIKYAFVGNAARCLSACAIQSVGPNGNAGVDGMVSVIAHELEEATTDPNLNAWYDSSGAENADKCAWTFGSNNSQHQLPSGAWYNIGPDSNGYYFLIQRNLFHNQDGSGDFCAISVTYDSNGKIDGYLP